MLKTIPLDSIPSQRFNIILDGQNCTLKLYQRGEFLFMDLLVDNKSIREGMICLVNINLLSYPSKDFKGLLFFSDITNMGGTPVFSELNSRYFLFFSPDGDNDV